MRQNETPGRAPRHACDALVSGFSRTGEGRSGRHHRTIAGGVTVGRGRRPRRCLVSLRQVRLKPDTTDMSFVVDASRLGARP